MGQNLLNLSDWVPIRLYWQSSQPMVDWCYLGNRRFSESFFEDTINKCMQNPFQALFRHQTSIETLVQKQHEQPGLHPTGFIFHLSRCGSTLLSQMLAALPQNRVLSEPHPIDCVLRAHLHHPEVSDSMRMVWLKAMVSALGQSQSSGEKHLFIKFDSWHTLDLKLIRSAYPDVPWLFVYRDPVEVMVSHMKRRGIHTVPGLLEPQLFGFEPTDAFRMQTEEYVASVLGKICEAACQNYNSGGGMLINYQQLPEVAYTPIANFFRVIFSPAEVDKMRQVVQFDAKNSSFLFVPDTISKKREASSAILDAVEKQISSLYTELECNR